MQDYKTYKAEEFASDPSFRKWVLDAGTEDLNFWENWLLEHPEKNEEIEQGRRILLSIKNAFENISDEEVKQNIFRLSEILESSEEKGERIRTLWQHKWIRIAASIAIVLGGIWWYRLSGGIKDRAISYDYLVKASDLAMTEKVNASEKQMLVTLVDGSTVILQKHSRISYPSGGFKSGKREVYLSGKAFFEIARDPSKPFYVYANNLVTKVLGTSFTIQAYQHENTVKVMVKTGKVSVFAGTKENLLKQQAKPNLEGLILTPNQQVEFFREDNHLVRTLIEKPEVQELAVQKQSLSFNHAPISEVFTALEKTYGVKIIFDSEVMKNCYLTADLEDEPLFEKLKLICRTIDARYEEVDAQIIVYSKGCP